MNALKQNSPPSSSICTNVWHNLEGGRTARRCPSKLPRRRRREDIESEKRSHKLGDLVTDRTARCGGMPRTPIPMNLNGFTAVAVRGQGRCDVPLGKKQIQCKTITPIMNNRMYNICIRIRQPTRPLPVLTQICPHILLFTRALGVCPVRGGGGGGSDNDDSSKESGGRLV